MMSAKKMFFATCLLFGPMVVVHAQGNIHSPGEGGVFTSNRLAGLKGNSTAGYAEEYDLGNNPSTMNLYSDMRAKFGRMGEEVNLTLEDIEGTIYLNKDFVVGTLYADGEAFKKIYLRYDAYNDEVELKEELDSEEVRSMVKHPLYSCSVNGNTYAYMEYMNEDGGSQEGYLSPIVSGDRYKLYVKKLKVFKEGKPAKTSLGKSFPHRFSDKTEYYVSKMGEKPMFMKTKKSEVLSMFTDEDGVAVKKYIKDNRTNINDGDDLRNLFVFGNSLQ